MYILIYLLCGLAFIPELFLIMCLAYLDDMLARR